MIDREITIVNKLGLHARAASKLVKLTSGFSSEIRLNFEDSSADAKSIMEVLVLGASIGSRLRLRICGEDEQEAEQAICQLIANRFGEDE